VEDHIDNHQRQEKYLNRNGDPFASGLSVSHRPQQHRGEHQQAQHPHIHVSDDLPHALHDGQSEPERIERCRDVVLEELDIPEYVPGVEIVERIPESQDQHRNRQRH
jgi:hypothetical protein